MDYLFLYRIKDLDDRDCCAYIENKNFARRFECGHYFASLGTHGACYCSSNFEPYENIETVLTKKEYTTLLKCKEEFQKLGYGIKEGDERYQKGLEICKRFQPILKKLQSKKAQNFFDKISESEEEYLMNKYSFSKQDIDWIFDEYCGDYQDRGIICYVYDNVEEVGKHYADEVDGISEHISKYFNYLEYGKDIIEDGGFIELDDGRVVELNYKFIKFTNICPMSRFEEAIKEKQFLKAVEE